MDRNESRRLARALLPYVALWLVLAAMLAAFAVYEIAKSRAQARESAKSELESIARLASEHALQTLSGIDRSLATFKALHARHLAGTGVQDLLSAIAASDDIEGRISLFDRDGRFVASSRAIAGDSAAIDMSDRSYFVEARNDASDILHIGAPVQGRLAQRMVVPLVRRLTRDDGTFDGVVVSAVSPSRLVTMYRSLRFGQSAQVGLVRDDGLVYARSMGSDVSPTALDQAVTAALGASRTSGGAFVHAGSGDETMLVALQ